MRRTSRSGVALGLVVAVSATIAIVGAVRAAGSSDSAYKYRTVYRRLTPSSSQLGRCMPNARIRVRIALTSDALGFDRLHVGARGLPRHRSFTLFLLQTAKDPFGAAEYIGDFTSDGRGRASKGLKLIVQEAFSSTLVGGNRVRVDLNRIGAWFAGPRGDNFCLGKNSPVTPFDGDNRAGVQAFNSARSRKLPSP